MLKELQIFKNIIFIEKNHTYKLIGKPDFKFISATAYKSKFIAKFRKEYWLAWNILKKEYPRYQLQHDLKEACPPDHFIVKNTVVPVTLIHEKRTKEIALEKKKWEKEANEGKERGNAIHLFLENVVNRKILPYPAKYKDEIKVAWEYFKETYSASFSLCEFVVGSEELGISGLIDRLDFFEDGTIELVDYKGDKDFTTQSDEVFGNTLLPPFEHLYSTSLNEYAIQVNIYRQLFELSGLKITKMKLVNITKKGYKIFEIPPLTVL